MLSSLLCQVPVSTFPSVGSSVRTLVQQISDFTDIVGIRKVFSHQSQIADTNEVRPQISLKYLSANKAELHF